MRGGAHRDLLATPLFVASVALLLLNDHVLKDAWPGLVTGKVSDVAGVVMLALMATALLGRPGPAFALVAVAFGLLKTVPDVAIAAAPVLGGVTRTDPTDLLALLALAPTWRWVQRRRHAPRNSRRPVARRSIRIVALGFAVVATTATSTDEPRTQIAVVDDRVYVWDGSDAFRSTDGGATWRRVVGGELADATDDAGRPVEACATDRCFRIVDDVVRRVEPGGDAVEVPEIDAIAPTGRPVGVVAVPTDDGLNLVVWYPSNGALRRTADGAWAWAPVEAFERSLAVDWVAAAIIVVMIALPLLMLASSGAAAQAARRRRWRASRVRDAVIATGAILLVVSIGVALLAAAVESPGLRLAWALGVVAVGGPVIVWSWSSRRSSRWSSRWSSRSTGDDDLPAPEPSGRRG